jgi:hypothetical protein
LWHGTARAGIAHTRHHARVNKVEFLGIRPWLFDIVNLEANIGWEAIGIGSAWKSKTGVDQEGSSQQGLNRAEIDAQDLKMGDVNISHVNI